MPMTCRQDLRRHAVRAHADVNGVDFVEVDSVDPRLLRVAFLGKLPAALARNRPGLERFVQIDGGERIRGLRVIDVDPAPDADPERDDWLLVRIDREGDFAPYTLRLVGLEGIDPRYASAEFLFHLDCAAEQDCAPPCAEAPPSPAVPPLSMLAKDYASLRQLLLDRLATVMPAWRERHLPDIGITLVELLAWQGDQLSVYQDAVATEAYLGTARQRISVRRHARLMDYAMHEGCNARAWVHVAVSSRIELPAAQAMFATGSGLDAGQWPRLVGEREFDANPVPGAKVFEPVRGPGLDDPLRFDPAHNAIAVYTWGDHQCCLHAGATSATLRDRWLPQDGDAPASARRALTLRPGDVLVFEQVRGARSGLPAEADPALRWPVRLTAVQPRMDALYGGEPGVPLLEVHWAPADALPFDLPLSALGEAPGCAFIDEISVARGNIVLVDHGRTQPSVTLPDVGELPGVGCCDCEGQPRPTAAVPAAYAPTLPYAPVVHAQPWVDGGAAAIALTQDPRAALAQVRLVDRAGRPWPLRAELMSSGASDPHAVVEIDNEGQAQLRFGDGRHGARPPAGERFVATVRVGGGSAGHVGADAITRLVLAEGLRISGVVVEPRNPLPAAGGIDAESIEQARLMAPRAHAQSIQRAITADDYAEIAAREPGVQRAAGALAWNGSWTEARVTIDAWAAAASDAGLMPAVAARLQRARRIGHDLSVRPALAVPLALALDVCALPGHERGAVHAAVLAALLGGHAQAGFFHPDVWLPGQAVVLSGIVACVQGVAGVECVRVTELHRLHAAPNQEIERGVLLLASHEVAKLEHDPNHPERGRLRIQLRGGY
jgi:hypothetical protein